MQPVTETSIHLHHKIIQIYQLLIKIGYSQLQLTQDPT